MSIQVARELYIPASGRAVTELREHNYLSYDGLNRRETRWFESQSDTADYYEHRDSPDNGRTWGEWVREHATSKVTVGNDEHEMQGYSNARNVWNPVHRHSLTLKLHRLYLDGYRNATDRYWNDGMHFVDHVFLEITNEARTETVRQMAAYEDGITEFDEKTYRQEAFLERNLGVGCSLYVMKNGDILFDVEAPVAYCCKKTGHDLEKVFPSTGKLGHAKGLMICRGRWNAQIGRYDLSFSEPMYLSDCQSSRGIDEPTIAELDSGKILVVMRTSTMLRYNWESRMSPYAPGYKYYSISDDGGKTFSPPMPWHFDSREVVYSSATYSTLLRSRANGKLYWIGNYTDPVKIHDNYPRYPLQIVEVDEEWGCAKKETLAVIDTRRDGEPEVVQLSNFSIIENRETGNFELYLSKYGQFKPERHVFDCESWKYTITLE